MDKVVRNLTLTCILFLYFDLSACSNICLPELVPKSKLVEQNVIYFGLNRDGMHTKTKVTEHVNITEIDEVFSSNCRPKCDPKCSSNSICEWQVPNKTFHCKCLKGYEESKDAHLKGRCDPICKEDCGEYGVCIKPYTCGCNNGYLRIKDNCEPICAPQCEDHSLCVSPGTCDCKKGYVGEGNHCMPKCDIECEDNSYCFLPNQCECLPGYEPDDLNSLNCSNSLDWTSLWLISVGVLSIMSIIAIVSCVALLCSRSYKKPSYSQHTDTIGSDLPNFGLPRVETSVEGIDNSTYF